jgi:hypothetical protein
MCVIGSGVAWGRSAAGAGAQKRQRFRSTSCNDSADAPSSSLKNSSSTVPGEGVGEDEDEEEEEETALRSRTTVLRSGARLPCTISSCVHGARGGELAQWHAHWATPDGAVTDRHQKIGGTRTRIVLSSALGGGTRSLVARPPPPPPPLPRLPPPTVVRFWPWCRSHWCARQRVGSCCASGPSPPTAAPQPHAPPIRAVLAEQEHPPYMHAASSHYERPKAQRLFAPGWPLSDRCKRGRRRRRASPLPWLLWQR